MESDDPTLKDLADYLDSIKSQSLKHAMLPEQDKWYYSPEVLAKMREKDSLPWSCQSPEEQKQYLFSCDRDSEWEIQTIKHLPLQERHHDDWWHFQAWRPHGDTNR